MIVRKIGQDPSEHVYRLVLTDLERDALMTVANAGLADIADGSRANRRILDRRLCSSVQLLLDEAVADAFWDMV